MPDDADEVIDAFIEGMKHELGVELDRELATKLGISPTAVAGWRSRKRIPAKYELRFRRTKDEQSDGLQHEQPSHYLRSAYLFRLVDIVSKKIYEDSNDGFQTEFTEMWRGYRLADAYFYFSDMLPITAEKDQLRAGFEKLAAEIENDDFINWIENLATLPKT